MLNYKTLVMDDGLHDWVPGLCLWAIQLMSCNMRKQVPEMTQWYTVCLRSRVNHDLQVKLSELLFTTLHLMSVMISVLPSLSMSA